MGRHKLFDSFDRDSKGFVTFDDLIAVTSESWNLVCTPAVHAELRQRYCRPENEDSGTIVFDDFISKVLPPDFKNEAEVMRVFKEKMTSNFKHLQSAFMKIDEDASGSITRDELVDQLRSMQIIADDDILEKIANLVDADGDGEIDFEEFAAALGDMTAEDVMGETGAAPKSLGLPWDPESEKDLRAARVGRPQSPGSLHSQSDDEEEFDASGQPEAHAERVSEDGVEIDIDALLKEKIYCQGLSTSDLRRAFQQMDKDGAGISRHELVRFLSPFNLNLSPRHISAYLGTFKLNAQGLIDFDEFRRRIMVPEYVRNSSGKMQGLLRLTDDRSRHIVRSFTPTISANVAFGKTADPVSLMRDKLTSRSQNVNDAHPGRQLRDMFRLNDEIGSGGVSDAIFQRVLRHFNIYISDDEFDAWASDFRRRADRKLDYGKFIRVVLAREPSAGYGPHVPTGVRRAAAFRGTRTSDRLGTDYSFARCLPNPAALAGVTGKVGQSAVGWGRTMSAR